MMAVKQSVENSRLSLMVDGEEMKWWKLIYDPRGAGEESGVNRTGK